MQGENEKRVQNPNRKTLRE